MWGVSPHAILNLTHAAGYVLDSLARNTQLRSFLSYPMAETEDEPSSWNEERKQARMAALEEQFTASTREFLSYYE